jgi:hypothetical protein
VLLQGSRRRVEMNQKRSRRRQKVSGHLVLLVLKPRISYDSSRETVKLTGAGTAAGVEPFIRLGIPRILALVV